MTVLVLGARSSTEVIAGKLGVAGAAVEQLDVVELMLARLASTPGAFGLILAERQGSACADRRLFDAIVETGTQAPVMFLDEPPSLDGASDPPPVCAIEQTPDGPRLLRCALAQARARPDGQPALADALGERPHVFAYCAPAKSGR